jgi:hypothetical protein
MNKRRWVPVNLARSRGLRTSVAVIGLVLGTATLTGGCTSSPPRPVSMRAPQVDFNSFKTFGWRTAGAEPSGQPLSILDSDIRAAITSELKRKGYQEAPAGTTPDLLIAFETTRAEKVESSPFSVGIGVGRWGGTSGGSVGATTSGVKNVIEGTLSVHAVDLARNAEVWNGRITRQLGKGNIEPALVQSTVAEVMNDFPARGP